MKLKKHLSRISIALIFGMLLLAGCSNTANETNTNAEIKNTVTNLSVENVEETSDKETINAEESIQTESTEESSENSAEALSPSEDLLSQLKNIGQPHNSTIENYTDYINSNYPGITQEQFDEIFLLLDDEYPSFLYYKEAVIAGQIDANAPKLSVDAVKDIIKKVYSDSKADTSTEFDFQDISKKIFEEIQKIQKRPDYVGGSGYTVLFYILESDDTTKKQIQYSPSYNLIDYYEYDSDGNEIYNEVLYWPYDEETGDTVDKEVLYERYAKD